ncbi:MAG: PhzF family phenazine biosynthesis protein [bacterium]
MNIPIYQVYAFTSEVFSGNPAAVCLLKEWLDNSMMQSIASENNLSETAFIIQRDGQSKIRWFTPKIEVDLCGHATLASAFVLFEEKLIEDNTVTFESQSGPLTVEQLDNGLLSMNFPSRRPVACEKPEVLEEALGTNVVTTLASRDLLVILENEEEVQSLLPNLELLSTIEEYMAVIVSAKGNKVDFVSRFFAPNAGIPEDPVTGSAHCTLIPYWSEQLRKDKLHALQLSPRGGELFCEKIGARVIIKGKAVMYMKGEIYI